MLMAEEVYHLIRVLANELLGAVARRIVPTHSVSVPVVMDSKTGLYGDSRTLKEILCIIRLWDEVVDELGKESCIRPRVFPPTRSRFVRGVNPDTRAGPEPSVDMFRLKMWSVTAVEVAKATRSPNGVNVELCHYLLNHLLFLLSLHADEVHTHLSADVPCVQPTCLVAPEMGFAREEVVVT